MPTMQKERIRLIHGSLTYRDKRLAGFDAATVVEVSNIRTLRVSPHLSACYLNSRARKLSW